MSMTLYNLSNNKAIVADTLYQMATKKGTNDEEFARLVLLHDGIQMNFLKLPGTVAAVGEKDDGYLCLTHERDKKQNRTRVVLNRLDKWLHKLSSEVIFETAHWYSSVFSAVDSNYIYLLHQCGHASVDLGDGLSFNTPTDLEFTRTDLDSGEKGEWSLEFIEDGELVTGYIIDLERLHFKDGKLLLRCSVFDPDNPPIWDDPEAEPDPTDSDYAKECAYPEDVVVDFDAKALRSKWFKG